MWGGEDGRLVKLAVWLFVLLFGWLVVCLVGYLFGWLAVCLVSWFVGDLVLAGLVSLVFVSSSCILVVRVSSAVCNRSKWFALCLCSLLVASSLAFLPARALARSLYLVALFASC